MEDNTIIDQTPAESQEVAQTTTGPAADERNETQDAWSEEAFDMSVDAPDEGPVLTDEPKEEPQTDNVPGEYITEGLGSFEEPLVIKYKGKLFDISDKDQARDLMERGMGATQKLQELADLKRQMLQDQNPDMSQQELNTATTQQDVETIAEKITASPYVNDFKSIVSALPDDTVNALRTDPRMLEGLRQDTESGLAQKIMKHAERYMAIDGLSFQEAYIKGGKQVVQSQHKGQEQVDRLTSEPRTSNNVKVEQKSVWDISDDEFKQIMSTERR